MKSHLRSFIVIFCLFLVLLFDSKLVDASFGITPPYVRNTSLTRNSTYEQQILLVRGNPNVPLNAQISIDAPELEGWIEIVEGMTIPLPRGEQKIPMTVRVRVPADAKFQDYSGKIRIRTVPADDQVAEGVVSISLGAQVDIGLTVIDRVIKDFRVRRIGVEDLNEGYKFGWLYFPGKINFNMLLENTGNVPIAPSEVLFKIYDRNGIELYEETKQIGKIKTIAPYLTDETTAFIPTRLPSGSYLVRYSIKNDHDIKQEGELNLSILPYGTLQVAGFGFSGLSFIHKLSVVVPVAVVTLIILFLIVQITTRRRRSSSYVR